MTVHWQQPAEQNGIIRKYRLLFTYTIDGRQTTITSETNNQTFSHSLDVFGGTQYSVEIWAETIKRGPTLTGTKQVPEYSEYLLFTFLPSVLLYQQPFEQMICVNGIRNVTEMISTGSYSSELQVLEIKERYSSYLKCPITLTKREEKRGRFPSPYFELLLPMSIVAREIYGVY